MIWWRRIPSRLQVSFAGHIYLLTHIPLFRRVYFFHIRMALTSPNKCWLKTNVQERYQVAWVDHHSYLLLNAVQDVQDCGPSLGRWPCYHGSCTWGLILTDFTNSCQVIEPSNWLIVTHYSCVQQSSSTCAPGNILDNPYTRPSRTVQKVTQSSVTSHRIAVRLLIPRLPYSAHGVILETLTKPCRKLRALAVYFLA